jgi:hypothetical protein
MCTVLYKKLIMTQQKALGRNNLDLLIIAAVVSVVLYNIPFGAYILYPFFILCTWFHEMGHAVATLLMGGWVNSIGLDPSGSGVTYHSHAVGGLLLGERLSGAFIAAAGLVGPPIIGAMFILFSRSKLGAKIMLWILVGFIVFSEIFWVRTLFGFGMMAFVGAFVVFALLRLAGDKLPLLAQFIGVQAALATFLNWRYLFSTHGGHSDTAHIAEQLFLPYWFWGAVIALFSAVVLVLSLRVAYRK